MDTFCGYFGRWFWEKARKGTFQNTTLFWRKTKCLSGGYGTFQVLSGCQGTPAGWSFFERKTKGRETKSTTFRTRPWAKDRDIWHSRPKLPICPSCKGGFMCVYMYKLKTKYIYIYIAHQMYHYIKLSRYQEVVSCRSFSDIDKIRETAFRFGLASSVQ